MYQGASIAQNTRFSGPSKAFAETALQIHAIIVGMRITLTAALILLLAAQAVAGPAHDVKCREIGFSQAAEHRDLEAFRSFIDADARFVSNSVLRGVDDIATSWSVFFADDGPAIRWRPQIIEVLEDGKLALSRGPFHVISKDADGNTVESWGTFNSVWRLHTDGQWRVVFDAGSPAAGELDEASLTLLDAEDHCS